MNANQTKSQLDKFGCINNTIKVFAGHYIDLLNPDPDSIDIESIAHALSMVCRFGGHIPRFYSVAEHCVRATYVAMNDGADLEVCKAVLLHDAAEAYIGDMVKPLKLIVPEFAGAEYTINRAIESQFEIDFSEHHDVIKYYDRIMLKAEKQFFWPEDKERWNGFGGVEEREVRIACLEPPLAKAAFLQCWNLVRES